MIAPAAMLAVRPARIIIRPRPIAVSATAEKEDDDHTNVAALLALMLSFGAATATAAEELSPQKCLPSVPESESWVANAEPMGTGTWRGIWCGTTKEGVDPESVYPAAPANLLSLPDGQVTLLLLTDDGHLVGAAVIAAADLSERVGRPFLLRQSIGQVLGVGPRVEGA